MKKLNNDFEDRFLSKNKMKTFHKDDYEEIKAFLNCGP
jgi:hypothetical protein